MLPGGYSHYLIDCLSIIVIDLLLAGDNALVIALAVRALPKRQRRVALLAGAWTAVLIRVAVTFLVARLLQLEYVQFAGGAFVVWIAVKVLRDARSQESEAVSPGDLWRAIGSIVLADLTMSTDNILAVAGASKGNIWLIVFGLALSIPLVVSSSTFLAFVMDKYPVTMYVGVAILGRVAGEMMLGDPLVRRLLHPSDALRYGVELALMASIVLTGRLLSRR
ncbi:MAG TPA: TerC family protein [Bryobacteraceae bacterium]|jgi:YjbE family integral membrane protein|nr:TerC family protein [Bryobacteraceae bacterium]